MFRNLHSLDLTELPRIRKTGKLFGHVWISTSGRPFMQIVDPRKDLMNTFPGEDISLLPIQRYSMLEGAARSLMHEMLEQEALFAEWFGVSAGVLAYNPIPRKKDNAGWHPTTLRYILDICEYLPLLQSRTNEYSESVPTLSIN